MTEATAVRETMLEFYERMEANVVTAFDRLVADDATLDPMTAAMARTAGDARPAGAADRSGAGP